MRTEMGPGPSRAWFVKRRAVHSVIRVRRVHVCLLLYLLLACRRQGLQGELAGEASFSVSPLATLEDLCTTHGRDYVQRYLENRFTDVSITRLLVPSTYDGWRGGEASLPAWGNYWMV